MTAAFVIVESEGKPALQWQSIALAPLGAGQVRLATHAAGINRADLYQLDGSYPKGADLNPIPGLEVAGIVEAIGEKVTRWKVGDKVAALVDGGGYAQATIAEEGLCFAVPETMPWEVAAALPEALMTVWMALFHYGALQAQESVLIYGGASGIGTIAIQCAQLWGAKIYATASTSEKAALCQRLGAAPILYQEDDLIASIARHTGKKGADVILDMVGGENAATNMRLAANGGRIITIALQMGSKAEIGFSAMLTKQLLWKGALLRRHALSQKIAFAEAVQQHFWPSVEKNVIFPVIDSVFALEDASIALEKMRRREHLGKMVLRCSS